MTHYIHLRNMGVEHYVYVDVVKGFFLSEYLISHIRAIWTFTSTHAFVFYHVTLSN